MIELRGEFTAHTKTKKAGVVAPLVMCALLPVYGHVAPSVTLLPYAPMQQHQAMVDPIGIIDVQHQTRNGDIFSFIDKTEGMKTMDDDWNGRGSDRPSNFVIEVATTILLTASNIRVPDRVAASAQGGIGIFFYNDQKYADIECFNTGEILGTTADGDGEPEVWTINPTETKAALEKIGNFLGA
jgi:hypothetical protein